MGLVAEPQNHESQFLANWDGFGPRRGPGIPGKVRDWSG